MNKLLSIVLSASIYACLSGCSPVRLASQNQYQLTDFAHKATPTKAQTNHSLLISQPEAVSGYLTNQMLYTDKRYELSAFTKTLWISPPANMLYPLLIESIEQSHYFSTLVASPYAGGTDLRLDSQILEFRQNFLLKPSVFEMTIKVVLTQVADNRSMASRVFVERIPCKEDTAYGGVIAANQATRAFTRQLLQFIAEQLEHVL